MQLPIETSRLILRAFQSEDAADVQHLANDPVIADTSVNIPQPYSIEHAETWIAAQRQNFAANSSLACAITSKKNG
jgi:[ribosomal protein S5]-alanine N-acetyltransferase